MGNTNIPFTIVFLTFLFFITTDKSDDTTVTFEQIQTLSSNQTVLLVDVRNQSEVTDTGYIPGSFNIPLYDLRKELTETSAEDFLRKFNKKKPTINTPIVFTCLKGIRSKEAKQVAGKLGYKNVKYYPGSWCEWSERTNKTPPSNCATAVE